ncbi:alpha/beta hydrolase fold domain-containing protein [Nocardia sp. NPDC050697]|uniref:alpha/beta hydrolase n=1 Tax=Nocardia sp. NPDC050697 TaxID=3155158 RepID=UPI003403EC5C
MSAVRTEDRTIPGRQGAIPVRDYLPAEPRPGAAPLIWLHGGGFVTGDLDTPESHRVALRLAAAGRLVRAVDYRLAPRPWGRRSSNTPPGHHYPAGLDDVLDASRALAAEHGRIVLGGASAGACLAVTAAQRLPGTAGLLLCYGLYHAELPALPVSVRRRTRGLAGYRQFTPAAVYKMNVNYVGREELLAGGAFPGGTDLTGLPPTLMLDADFDTLRASGETFAAELDAAGVPVAHAVVPHSWHGYLNRHRLNAFRFALTAMNGWLGKRDAAIARTP